MKFATIYAVIVLATSTIVFAPAVKAQQTYKACANNAGAFIVRATISKQVNGQWQRVGGASLPVGNTTC